ncbi:MAG: hypothetical protein K2N06_05405 [Oscillospiraceae bacterium]|nr:hypothetical protein [Oscillospiraceae bacterium]
MNETRGLWRGKRINNKEHNGEWVEGALYPVKYTGFDFPGSKHYYLIPYDGYYDRSQLQVDPSTLGRCTGLRDKSRNLIFEGDIVEVNHPYNGKSIHKVVWDDFCWNLEGFYASCFDYPSLAFSEGTKYMTVIGNIHDNPELLNATGEDIGNAAQGTIAPAT